MSERPAARGTGRRQEPEAARTQCAALAEVATAELVGAGGTEASY